MKLRGWQWAVVVVWVAVTGAVMLRSQRISQGRDAFERLGCASCHLAGGAPSLEHVGSKYERAYFLDFLGNPEAVYARVGRKPINKGYGPMPRMEMTDSDINRLSYFLAAQN